MFLLDHVTKAIGLSLSYLISRVVVAVPKKPGAQVPARPVARCSMTSSRDRESIEQGVERD